MSKKLKIELTEKQLITVTNALHLMAQQYFEFAIESANEEQSQRCWNKQIEYDSVLDEILKQQNH